MVQVDFGITDLAVVTPQVETALTPDETVVEVFGALMILVVEFSQDDVQFFLSSDAAPLLAVVSVLATSVGNDEQSSPEFLLIRGGVSEQELSDVETALPSISIGSASRIRTGSESAKVADRITELST